MGKRIKAVSTRFPYDGVRRHVLGYDYDPEMNCFVIIP